MPSLSPHARVHRVTTPVSRTVRLAAALGRLRPLILFLTALESPAVGAAPVTFDDNGNGNLAAPANWSTHTLPGTSDVAVVATPSRVPLTLQNSSLTVLGLQFQPAAGSNLIELVSSGAAPAVLSIGQDGLINRATGNQSFLLASPDVTLNFIGAGSSISGAVTISNSAVFAQTNFAAGASAGSAQISNTAGGTTSLNDASAGQANIEVGANSSLLLTNGASAAQSKITIDAGGTLGFSGSSSAATATIRSAGTTVFAGTSTASGATIQNSAALVLANGASLGQAQVSNSGQMTLSGTASAGTASLSNSGQLVFTDQSSAADASVNNAHGASLTFSLSSSAGNAQLANTGTLSLTDAARAGTAQVLNQTSGVLRFAGLADASSARIDNLGSLDASAMQAVLHIGALDGPGSVALGTFGVALGALNQDDLVSGVITGPGGLTKLGSGTLTLTGANRYTGSTAVDSGTLQLDGSLTSPVAVFAGATLAGSGSTTQSVSVAALGRIAPGTSQDLLHIGGNLLLSAQSVLVSVLEGTGTASLVDVAGSARLAGARLDLQALGAALDYNTHTSYTLLVADQGVSGQFSAVTSNLSTLLPHLTYGPNAVTLNLTQLAFSGGGAAPALNGLASSPSPASGSGDLSSQSGVDQLIDGLNQLGSRAQRNALYSLGPSDYSVLRRYTLDETETFARVLAERLFARSTPVDDTLQNAWLSIDQRAADVKTTGGEPSAAAATTALRLGTDLEHSSTTMLGLAAQLLRGGLDLGDGAHADHQGVDVALLGRATFDAWVASGILTYGRHNDDVQRQIRFADYDQSPASRPHGDEASGYGELGWRVLEDQQTWMPYVALHWVAADDQRFEEGGGAAADLVGEARRAELFTRAVGIRVLTPWHPALDALGAQGPSWISAGVAWLHSSGGTDGRIDATFVADATSTPFSATTEGTGRDRLSVNLDLHTEWRHAWRLQARLLGEAGSGTRAIEGYAGASYVW